jgi:hypothetical protein
MADTEPKGDAIFRAADTTYRAMWAARDASNNTWEGYTTHLMTKDLGIPVPYYGKALDALQRMGCLTQLQRGGGRSPSKWLLHKTPTLEAYLAVKEELHSRPRGKEKYDVLEQKVSDLAQSLQGLDVARALSNMQSQIDQQDVRIKELEGA